MVKNPKNHVTNFSRHTYALNPKVTEHLEALDNYCFFPGDITHSIKLLKTLQDFKPDYIVHFAASTHVDRSFVYPEEFFHTNAFGTFTLLEAIRHLNYKPQLLYVSTDEVFGDVPTKSCKELDRLAPRNPYSASKAAAEMFVNAYYHSFDLPTTIIRLMNNYGPRQHPEKLISKIITRCLTDTPFTLFEGGSVRGWIYVKDTCEAIEKVLAKGQIGGIYHVPPATYKNVPEVAETILGIMEKQHLFQGFKGTRLKDDERYSLDGSKMTNWLGWTPQTLFEDGLKETIIWFQANPWFWENVHAP